MSDLRNLLDRGVGGFEPDPHRGYERTMDRVRRRGRGRRIASGAVALVLFAGAGSLVWSTFRPGGEAGEEAGGVAAEEPLGALPEGWVRCTNEGLGFSVGYPGDWFTTDVITVTSDVVTGPEGSEETLSELACTFFDPRPFTIPYAGEFPVTALMAGLDERPFARVEDELTDPVFNRVLSSEVVTVGGMPAVRQEVQQIEGLYTGTRYEYVIDLGGDRTFVVSTMKVTSFGPPDEASYEANKAIVDQAAETIRLEPAAPAPALTEGWTECVNEALGYAIGYPEGWFTPGGTVEDETESASETACTEFNPQPIGPGRVPAVTVTLDDRPFDVIAEMVRQSPEGIVLSEAPIRAGEWSGVVFVSTYESSTWAGYVVDLGERGTLSVTVNIAYAGDPSVAQDAAGNRQIVGQMIESFRLL